MDRAAFESAKREVMASGQPSAGDDLLGMEMDFFLYLGRPDVIHDESIKVQRTGNPEFLIEASCRMTDGGDLTRAMRDVEALWGDHVRYEYREAHFWAISDERAPSFSSSRR